MTSSGKSPCPNCGSNIGPEETSCKRCQVYVGNRKESLHLTPTKIKIK